MGPKITVNEDYILVEPEGGANFREIKRGIARLIYVPEIRDKNDIWIFSEGLEKLSPDDLYKLRDIIKEIHPKDSKAIKTALVVESEAQPSLAEAYTQIAKFHPRFLFQQYPSEPLLLVETAFLALVNRRDL
ncbi:MAG: hypothetical protein PVI00_07810 [Desulfobacterales bacterium]